MPSRAHAHENPPLVDVSTVAAPGLDLLKGLFVLDDGTLVASAGQSIHVLPHSELLSVLAGSNTRFDYQDGPGADARFDDTAGITVDPADNVVLVDRSNHALRLLSNAGAVDCCRLVSSFFLSYSVFDHYIYHPHTYVINIVLSKGERSLYVDKDVYKHINIPQS